MADDGPHRVAALASHFLAKLTTDHTEPWRVPLPGAVKTYTKAAMQVKDVLQPLLQEVFGSQ